VARDQHKHASEEPPAERDQPGTGDQQAKETGHDPFVQDLPERAMPRVFRQSVRKSEVSPVDTRHVPRPEKR